MIAARSIATGYKMPPSWLDDFRAKDEAPRPPSKRIARSELEHLLDPDAMPPSWVDEPQPKPKPKRKPRVRRKVKP